MKARISINPRDAVKKGLNYSGTHTIDFDPVDLTEEQRIELSLTDTTNDEVFILDGYYGATSPTFESLSDVINAKIEQRKERKADQEKKNADESARRIELITRWIETPDEKCIVSRGHNEKSFNIEPISYSISFNDPATMSVPGVQEKYDRLKGIAAQMLADYEIEVAEKKRIRAQREAEIAAEEAAKSERRKNQIETWVMEHGTENQKARYVAGLLDTDEIIDCISDGAYATLSDWPIYETIAYGDFCECEYDPDIDYTVCKKEFASADEFDQMQEIKRIIPSASLTLRKHTAECSHCNNSASKTGIMVRVTVGEFEFDREYELK